jgi:CopG family nickel-responsive transcriptional regulator
MDRFTISLDPRLAREFDALVRERGYPSRSEAVRDILRTQLSARRESGDPGGPCVATLSYVYNHHERDLAERLAALQHAHHELVVSTMHAHLDHDHCIETVILKGRARAVRAFADLLTSERGVRHGQLNLVSVEFGAEHSHDGRPHRHLTPAP